MRNALLACLALGLVSDCGQKAEEKKAVPPPSLITVIHAPTGISFTADSGGPQMNRKSALDQVRKMVERAIKEARDAVASEVPGS